MRPMTDIIAVVSGINMYVFLGHRPPPRSHPRERSSCFHLGKLSPFGRRDSAPPSVHWGNGRFPDRLAKLCATCQPRSTDTQLSLVTHVLSILSARGGMLLLQRDFHDIFKKKPETKPTKKKKTKEKARPIHGCVKCPKLVDTPP